MSASAKPAERAVLIFGEDDFSVKQRARQLYQEWTEELGGMDHETIDGTALNSTEALSALARLHEALQTLPFFGSSKVIWLRDCNFLGDERAAQTKAVTERLAELSQELKGFRWENVRLIISAGKVDKRKTFYKTLEKIGKVESFDAWSVNDRNWAEQAALWGRNAARNRNKQFTEDAISELIARVGPHPRQIDQEIEKLSLYVADQPVITRKDVEAVAVRNKMSKAFALGDALGDRELPRLLKRLDEELWELRTDRSRSEIGLLYGLISKVRALLLLKELLREGLVKATDNYSRFKQQLESIPAEVLPSDRRYNPLALNPYVLFKALPQVHNYSEAELVRAMDLLLRCNQRLVTSGLDESLLLQQTLIEIAGTGGASGSRQGRSAA